jgi:hypothetical protein
VHIKTLNDLPKPEGNSSQCGRKKREEEQNKKEEEKNRQGNTKNTL